ncbi:hypothetical protein [Lignipirellula cremea]|uniref:DUF4412 domain-containing protein n=1 Tax=Lignipirellula cremea TaxID=2528010 RepID=A0A518E1I8_9BACT|nr:hypothetical protein [Lignipirellula cremea]QDU97966.1 hypothetical protein Pla8534_58250 [Lignipirellula cremea]
MRHVLLSLFLFTAVCGASATAWGQQFRVESTVFEGAKTEPLLETLTLFNDGVIYDFMNDAHKVTVTDPARERIVLLDTERKLQCTFAMQELGTFVENLRDAGSKRSEPWFFDPKFEVTTDSDGWVVLAARPLTYKVKGAKPSNSLCVTQYQRFADWSARLNATRPGNMMPFARIEVNRVMAERGEIPEEVNLTLASSVLKRGLSYRSKHAVIWSLSKTDRQKIEDVGEHMAEYATVSFTEFYGDPVAADKP